MKQCNKKFPEGIRTAIEIRGIRDRQLGINPEYIICKSVRQLQKQLLDYMPSNGRLPYKMLLQLVKRNGIVTLIKQQFGNRTIYRL